VGNKQMCLFRDYPK